MRVYLSGPLQGSSDLVRARHLYEGIARTLEAVGHEVYVPHLHTDPERAAGISAEQVFQTDVRQLLWADAIVAHIGAPSTGVGAELAIATHEGKRIIAVRRVVETPSRFALGLVLSAGGTAIAFERDDDAGDRVLRVIGDASRSVSGAVEALTA
jgi:nucleoside 2-deoxyribosyltransferase